MLALVFVRQGFAFFPEHMFGLVTVLTISDYHIFISQNKIHIPSNDHRLAEEDMKEIQWLYYGIRLRNAILYSSGVYCTQKLKEVLVT